MERMTELQQSKYQDLQAGLPSELSMQLAEVALALGSAEDQVIHLGYSLNRLLCVLCSIVSCMNLAGMNVCILQQHFLMLSVQPAFIFIFLT